MCTIKPSMILRTNLFKDQRQILSSYLTRNNQRQQQQGYAATNVEKNTKEKKNPKNLTFRKYWMSRYVDYIKNFEVTLGKKIPTPMHVYRVFSLGSKQFYVDLKKYFAVRKKHKRMGVESLTREELELSYNIPKDLVKVSPLFLLSAIPFTNYIIFPLAFLFPRLLLTSHYWSLEQRFNFMLHYHKKRLRHNLPLLRCIQSQVHKIENPLLKIKWSGVVACLGSGTHPSVCEIIACIDLFTRAPYSLESLTGKHLKELLAIHGMYRWTPYRKRRLLERGMLIKHMDNAIKREGGVAKLPNDAIRWALSFRGVNPVNMSQESMQTWLENWLIVSSHVEQSSISLLLHSPILLAYNYPTNWTLLYY